MQNRSLGGGDGNGQISGRQKQKEEIDRDRRRERKEAFSSRNDSPPESVYLPSQPEKSHWWTHG